MKTWKTPEDQCYLCKIKDGEQYLFSIINEFGERKESASPAKLIPIKRRFDKENEVIFTICTRCYLLTVLDSERDNFRFGFMEEPVIVEKPVSAENPIGRLDNEIVSIKDRLTNLENISKTPPPMEETVDE
jgi:hypothetical protein